MCYLVCTQVGCEWQIDQDPTHHEPIQLDIGYLLGMNSHGKARSIGIRRIRNWMCIYNVHVIFISEYKMLCTNSKINTFQFRMDN